MTARRYLTASEAIEYLRLPSRGALDSWLYRRRKAGIPVRTHRLGGRLRFRPEDLDAAMHVEEADPRRLRKVG